MQPEDLAFHDALNRRITINLKDKKVSYFFHAESDCHKAFFAVAPFDTGKIDFKIGCRSKKDKILIQKETICEMLKAAAVFGAVCAKYGYINWEEE